MSAEAMQQYLNSPEVGGRFDDVAPHFRYKGDTVSVDIRHEGSSLYNVLFDLSKGFMPGPWFYSMAAEMRRAIAQLPKAQAPIYVS